MHLNFDNLKDARTSVLEDTHSIESLNITTQHLVRKVNHMRSTLLDLCKQGQINLQNMQTCFPMGKRLIF